MKKLTSFIEENHTAAYIVVPIAVFIVTIINLL